MRNRGTIGGSLANNDPAADYPAAALALGATIVTSTREIAADQFFRGMFETALAPGELITAVKLPIPARRRLRENAEPGVALRAGRRLRRKVRGRRARRGDRSGPCVFRVPAIEAALAKRFEPGAVNGHGVDPAGLSSDIHAEAAFRAHLIGVMAKRAVATALANS